jgi:hypothetical protein
MSRAWAATIAFLCTVAVALYAITEWGSNP